LGSATVALRVDISEDLKARGLVRELVRQINSLRRDQGLTVHDKVKVSIAAPDDLRSALAPFENVLREAMQATEEEINAVENIGPVVSKSVYEYFHTKENLKYIDKLLQNGVVIESYNPPAGIRMKLLGKTFVVTGTLASMSRVVRSV
jgi:valyl-tRNA synthetase